MPVTGWGDNGFGQGEMPGAGDERIAIAAGAWHTLALRADGGVVAWGDNSSGQCDFLTLAGRRGHCRRRLS